MKIEKFIHNKYNNMVFKLLNIVKLRIKIFKLKKLNN